MDEKITAYIIGRIKLGSELENEDPETQAQFLLKTFKEIEEVDVITGEWDLMVRFKVSSMDEYYQVAWGIARHIERGWGTLVARKIGR